MSSTAIESAHAQFEAEAALSGKESTVEPGVTSSLNDSQSDTVKLELGEDTASVPIRATGNRNVAMNDVQDAPDLSGLSVLPFTYPPTTEKPVGHDEPSARLVKLQNRRANMHFAALCFSFFMGGWNDAATGPLLPTIQRIYKVDFAVVSILFIVASVGAIIGGLLNMRLADKLGMGKIYFFAALAQVIGYAIQASAPPFPLLAFAFGIDGLGWSIQISQANSHVTSMKNNASRFGIMHASYGVAATTVPLVSTQFARTHRWSFHYLTSLGLAIINAMIIASVLQFKRQEELLELSGDTITLQERQTNHSNKFRRMMRMREVHFLAFWAFTYVGAEVTTGGWINTFLIDLRGAGASTGGYVVTGFWGGRVAFLWVNHKVGERRVLFIYSICAIGLQITVWLIPSLLENAIAISFVGLFLGPMFPIAMRQAGKVFPRVLLPGAIGWISALGQAGSAFFPFATGSLANKFGIASLQPFTVSMMAAMVGCWALVPNDPRRVD